MNEPPDYDAYDEDDEQWYDGWGGIGGDDEEGRQLLVKAVDDQVMVFVRDQEYEMLFTLSAGEAGDLTTFLHSAAASATREEDRNSVRQRQQARELDRGPQRDR
jgi:hypothetical protein